MIKKITLLKITNILSTIMQTLATTEMVQQFLKMKTVSLY